MSELERTEMTIPYAKFPKMIHKISTLTAMLPNINLYTSKLKICDQNYCRRAQIIR